MYKSQKIILFCFINMCTFRHSINRNKINLIAVSFFLTIVDPVSAGDNNRWRNGKTSWKRNWFLTVIIFPDWLEQSNRFFILIGCILDRAVSNYRMKLYCDFIIFWIYTWMTADIRSDWLVILIFLIIFIADWFLRFLLKLFIFLDNKFVGFYLIEKRAVTRL